MTKARKHSKLAPILFTIAFILTIALSTIWIGRAFLEHSITLLLERDPLKIDSKSYTTKIGDVAINIRHRTISLSDIKIITHPSRNSQQGPTARVEILLPKITATGVRYIKKTRKQKTAILSIDSLIINSPSILFNGTPTIIQQLPKRHTNQSPTAININKIIITDASTNINRWIAGSQMKLFAKGLNIDLSNIHIAPNSPNGSSTQVTTPRPLPPQQSSPLPDLKHNITAIILSADTLAYTFQNGSLALCLDSLEVNTTRGTLTAAQLSILPQYSKLQYNEKVGNHSDWIYLSVEDVVLSGINLKRNHTKDNTLYADRLTINRGILRSYKDRNQLQSTTIKPTLYQTISRIPIGINIPNIKINNLDIYYQEVSPGAKTPGDINITNINVDITGLTNRPTTKKQQYTIYASGLLLGSAKLSMLLTLPADHLIDTFTAHATLSSMPTTKLSQITESMANIRITSGDIISATIDINGDSIRAKSKVSLLYNNFKVIVLNKDDHHHKQELLTFIANDLILRHSNPQKDNLKIESGEAERNKQKSFWNYIWKTAFAGIKKIAL